MPKTPVLCDVCLENNRQTPLPITQDVLDGTESVICPVCKNEFRKENRLLDLDSKRWKEFVKFAKRYYLECMIISRDVAGAENARTIQIFIDKLTPNLLELWKFYNSIY